jgi:hypothetical protein
MNSYENYDVLGRALAKDKTGRGITATEGRMISDFEQGKIGRDHFSTIASTPMRLPTANLKPEDDSTRTARRLSIEQIDGLQEKLRSGNPDLETRVQVIEGIINDLSQRTISVCVNGTPKTMIILGGEPY